jgi:hypothetical protein
MAATTETKPSFQDHTFVITEDAFPRDKLMCVSLNEKRRTMVATGERVKSANMKNSRKDKSVTSNLGDVKEYFRLAEYAQARQRILARAEKKKRLRKTK